MTSSDLLEPVRRLACEAGRAILDIYERPQAPEVSRKADDSPLTAADLAAHRVIAAGLRELTPTLPLVSEESAVPAWEERRTWRRYWLVDPLDGTKEFIGRTGEFTVNIALIEDGVPVLGVVHVPVRGLCYTGDGQGAMLHEDSAPGRPIRASALDVERTLRVVASRRHGAGVLERWLEAARTRFSGLELLNMGSSLKICLVAEGRADVYPRLAPTSEWDTAAAQAVLEAAGGALLDESGEPYRYNRKADILNPPFLAVGDASYAWAALSAEAR